MGKRFTILFFVCIIGFFLCLVFGVYRQSTQEVFLVKDNRLITNLTVTDLEREKVGKHKYEYYIDAKKEGSTYKFKVTEADYNEIKNLDTQTNMPKLDIVFHQGMYAEKTAVGISFSNKRR